MKYKFLALAFSLVIGGCAQHTTTQPLVEKIDNKNKMTLGIIQKDIKKGMQKSDVLLILGSPNLVSNNENTETWVYDKISTETSTNTSNVTAGAAGIGAVLGAFASASATNNSTSLAQSTLTAVLIFDQNNSLEKISYHTSRF